MKKPSEVITVIAIVTGFTLIGMMPMIAPAVKKPADRAFNGMHGYLDDYIGYASYVKEGMYGLNTFRIRSLPKNQRATSANLAYIAAGKVARVFRWNAPMGYHATRAFLGATYVLGSYLLLRRLFGSHGKAVAATLLAFSSSSLGWYVKEAGNWVYKPLSVFSFIDNVAGRVTTRLHYILGAILFLVLVMLFLKYAREKRWLVLVGYGVLGFLLGITHPVFGLILGVTLGFVGLIEIANKGIKTFSWQQYVFTFVGLAGGLLLSKWSTSVEPYTSILAFEEYVYYERLGLATIIGDIKTFGPTLWIGFPGLIYALVKSKARKRADLVMFFWLVTHFLMFFSLYSIFRAERFRFIQSLYFIPMAYGTVIVFSAIGKKIGKWVLPVATAVLLVLFVPSFINGFRTDYYFNTNYKTWSVLIFPTHGQMEAFQWLDANTPLESTVIASFEAANNIIVYSHNWVIGNTQGWPDPKAAVMVRERDNFYSGMQEDEALQYLRDRDVSYVYNGYQEKTLGDVTRYSFLTNVWENDEVEIYRVD